MACNGCNASVPMTKDQVENLLNKLINEGSIQAGLKSCGDAALAKGAQVVLCTEIRGIIEKMIADGLIDTIKGISVEEGKIVITNGKGEKEKITTPFISDLAFDVDANKLTYVADGRDKEIKLPYLKATATDKEVALVLPDGTTITVPKAGNSLTKDAFGNTIKEGALTPGKFDVDATRMAGKGIKADENGKFAIDTSELLNNQSGNNNSGAGSGLRDDGQGGIRVEPGDFIDNSTIIIDPNTGRIKIANKAPVNVTNLNNLHGLGVTYFYGNICNDNGQTVFVPGVPTEFGTYSGKTFNPAANVIGDLVGTQCYDFNGYQIASEAEVHQYIMNGNDVMVRSFDAGMNADGTLKSGTWSDWNRTDNVNLVDMDGFEQLRTRVTQLENRLNQPCATNIALKAADYTPTVTDEMLIFTGGQTVNFQGNIPVGKQWTIVNDSDAVTTLAAPGGEIIPPYKGSLNVKGKNAIVTVVKTGENQYRVFGQTENA